jgi:S-DNA-T family DNA segregation ATPase FtsK/SpoIIIE
MARKARKKSARRKAPAAGNGKGSAAAQPAVPRPRWFWRISAALVLIGASALAWMSLLTHDPLDPPLYAAVVSGEGGGEPNTTPPAVVHLRTWTMGQTQPATMPTTRIAARPSTAATQPTTAAAPATRAASQPTTAAAPTSRPAGLVTNAAGVVGAYTAHGLLYYVGGGVYVAVAFLTVAAVLLIFRGRIPGLPLRLAGVALLVVATSAALYMAQPNDPSDPLTASAGRAGVRAGQFLLTRFAVSGGWTVLIVAYCVAAMMTAERLLLVVPRCVIKWRQSRREAAAKAAGEAEARQAAGDSAAASGGEPTESAREKRRRLDEIRRRLAAMAPAAAEAGEGGGSPREAASGNGAPGDAEYELPSRELLAAATDGQGDARRAEAEARREVLQRTLGEFGVAAEVVDCHVGPVVTLFELSLAAGVKVSEVSKLSADVARSLAVPAVRVVSPLPGRSTIGVEVPNDEKEIVRLRELLDRGDDEAAAMALPMHLGKDAEGEPIVADLARMPHMLIAGTTGSGKSVCINTILTGLLTARRPADVRLVLVDPKMVEMAPYEGTAHLLCPIVHDMGRAGEILAWAAKEMDRRYELLKDARVRSIADFAALGEPEAGKRLAAAGRGDATTRMPYIVVVVDELADLIMTAGKDVEGHIIRIAQKARAVGIHLILATQRPSVNVVTGLIKSNMPCRVSFRVASKVESRIVLDRNGAEGLLGHGDMLMLLPGSGHLVRAQGTFVADEEISAVVEDLRGKASCAYHPELTGAAESEQAAEESTEAATGRDALFDQAVEVILAARSGSISLLQRSLSIGYGRAGRIIDQMTEIGLLGEPRGTQARHCLITLDDWRGIRT